jgi:hypothetical protein
MVQLATTNSEHSEQHEQARRDMLLARLQNAQALK